VFKSKSRMYTILMVFLLTVIVTGYTNDAAQAARAPAATWSFVILGDTRGDFDPTKMPPYDITTQTGVSNDLGRISAEVALLNPDFVLHVGDLILGDLIKVTASLGFKGLPDIPFAQQYVAFKTAVKPITDKGIPIYTVRGNHEVSCGDGINGPPDPAQAAAYYQAMGQYMPQNYTRAWGRKSGGDQRGLTYSFTHKQVTVVAVDQYSYYVAPDPQPVPWYAPKNVTWGTNLWGFHTIDQAWVSDQLKKAKTPFKIVFAHEPVFVASAAPYPPNGQEYEWFAELYFGPSSLGGQARRQEFVDMLGNNGVQLYAVGHVHNMSIASFTDTAGHKMYQLTAGNGGAYPMNNAPNPPTPEPALKGAQYELEKPGFTYVTVNPNTNKMLMEYYVMDRDDHTWSRESFTTEIPGS